MPPAVNGMVLTPEIIAAVQQHLRLQPPQLQVAQPLNDVQIISLVGGYMCSHAPGGDPNQLLDLATKLVAGAYARVADGRFQAALNDAKKQSDEVKAMFENARSV